MAGIEHMAFGLAAKPIVKKVNVFILLISTEVLDILYFPFYFINKEIVAFWTHSLIMAIVWSILFGVIAFLYYKDKFTALIIGLLVFSHWILDFITHPMTCIFPNQINPDLPLFFENSLKVGLGLYRTLPGVIIGNVLLWGVSLFVYINYRKKRLK